MPKTKPPVVNGSKSHDDEGPMRQPGFSSKRAAAIVDITYRQIDHWAREEVVRPSGQDACGSGSRRQYTYHDLLVLKVVKRMRDAGIPLKKIKEIIDYLRDVLGQDVASANLVITPAETLVKTNEQIIDLLRKGQTALNILPLEEMKDDLDAAVVRELPSEDIDSLFPPQAASV